MSELRPLTNEEYDEIKAALHRVPLGTASALEVRSEEAGFLILRELLDLKERMTKENV